MEGTQAQVQPVPERSTPTPQQALRTKLNDSTLLVATGRPSTSYLGMVGDMAALPASGDEVRIVPVAGAGGVQTLRDLLFLRGIDMAIVPSNCWRTPGRPRRWAAG